ncbi:MAG: TonB-dependent receptor [Flavobacteriales bacterium]
MIKQILFVSSILCSSLLYAQTRVSGIVKNADNGETIVGAVITYGEGLGTVTELDGTFELLLSNGEYELNISFVGYKNQIQKVSAQGVEIFLQILLETEMMQEVEIIGDLAIDRKTPVAFSNIPTTRIKEELGTQDIPMILNSTPGIHATQGGGGDGDSRVNIRGFENRNVAVMVDGIPMNDMENGTVYWANWFGLDVVTRSIQVQRGLGASKLAIPSIGGTINIMSDGIEEKKKVVIATEYGNNNNARVTVGLNSGRMKNGWGVTSAISARYNEGWVENLGSRQLFYFLKVQKQFEKHSFSFTVMGSPQQHNQRINRQPIGYYDEEFAHSVGVDTTANPGADYGLRHNEFWGYITRNRVDANAEEEVQATRINYYHKPITNFKHLWTPNDKFALSNIVYASFGNGGGVAASSSSLNAEGQVDLENQYYENTHGTYGVFNIYYPQWDTLLVNDTNKYKAEHYLFSRVNSHVWFGMLSTFKYKYNDVLEFSGGLDGRYYRTNRYLEIYDLLGSDYAVPAGVGGGDLNSNDNGVRYVGDKFEQSITSFVHQAGAFGLAEYEKGQWSAFVNATASVTFQYRTDYYDNKNEDGSFKNSGWLKWPAGTLKGGCSYQIDEQMSVFANTGFISRAPMLRTALQGATTLRVQNVQNEEILSIEGGYLFKNRKYRLALNGYATQWNNRPVVEPFNDGSDVVFYFVPGMNARHYGGELELEYKLDNLITIEGAFSYGDWRWISDGTATVTNENGDVVLAEFDFAAKGVLVGDAAQLQTGLGIRYSPVTGLYIKPRITYFDKYYANFDPSSLQGENANRQSWKIPSYYQLDVNMGYNMDLGDNKNKLGFKLNLMNVTNNVFISDATNNDFGNTFDANSAGVFMGMGFRWNLGASYTF